MRPASLNILRDNDLSAIPMSATLSTLIRAGRSTGRIPTVYYDKEIIDISLKHRDQSWRALSAPIAVFESSIEGTTDEILVDLVRYPVGPDHLFVDSLGDNYYTRRLDSPANTLRILCLALVHGVKIGSALRMLRTIEGVLPDLQLFSYVIIPGLRHIDAYRVCALFLLPYEKLPTLLGIAPDLDSIIKWRLALGV